jgi:anti-sigma-K factor RskA
MTRLRLSGLRRRRAEHERAPAELRSRVLRKVRAEPAPLGDLPHRARRRVPAVLAVLGALALAGALAGIVVLASAGGESHMKQSAESDTPGPHVSLHRAGEDIEMTLTDMPAPPTGEIYELWLLRPGRAPRAVDDMFAVSSSGRAVVNLPDSLAGVREAILTAEPRGGSATPSGPVVLRVAQPGRDAH